MTTMIPHKTLVVVADGAGARLFRNSGAEGTVALVADGAIKPSDLGSDGPSGHRPDEQKPQEIDEATFVKQLAHELTRRALANDFATLVLIMDPQSLGQIRPQLHKEVQSRLLAEIGKTLTHAPIKDIERTLSKFEL